MKVNRLEAHDRLLVFKKQSDYISEGCQECIENRPQEFKNHPFYIFAHCRTHENGYSKRLIWEPRLTKPKAQTNSMLFRSYPPSDKVKIIWMIPDREMWEDYAKNTMLESQVVTRSVHDFQFNRDILEAKEHDDLEESLIVSILAEIGHNARMRKEKKTWLVESMMQEDADKNPTPTL